jgi:hypothetical protein
MCPVQITIGKEIKRKQMITMAYKGTARTVQTPKPR